MRIGTLLKFLLAGSVIAALSACGATRNLGRPATERPSQYTDPTNPNNLDTQNTIWSIFNRDNQETKVLVNRYLWAATLQTLDFLPIQSIDPFTGVIVTGFGTPPNGSRAYRATILINDPALDARSLNVALQTRSGPASPATIRAVEDAILTRARQLRIADSRL